MVRADTAVHISLRVDAGLKGDAARSGAAAPRGDGERLGAAGLTEAMAAPGEKLT
jgi:hypothetical protein